MGSGAVGVDGIGSRNSDCLDRAVEAGRKRGGAVAVSVERDLGSVKGGISERAERRRFYRLGRHGQTQNG